MPITVEEDRRCQWANEGSNPEVMDSIISYRRFQHHMHHYGAMIGMRLDASEMEQAQRRQSFAANVLGRLQANCTDEEKQILK